MNKRMRKLYWHIVFALFAAATALSTVSSALASPSWGGGVA